MVGVELVALVLRAWVLLVAPPETSEPEADVDPASVSSDAAPRQPSELTPRPPESSDAAASDDAALPQQSPDEADEASEQSEIATLHRQTEQIYDLLQERLDPWVDPGSLLVVEPHRGSVAEFEALLRSIRELRTRNEGSRRRRWRHPEYPSPEAVHTTTDLASARAALHEAQRAFLGLPVRERTRLLEVHRRRHAEAADAEARVDVLRERLARLLVRAILLERLLARTLEPGVNLEALLTLEILDEDGSRIEQLIAACDAIESSPSTETAEAGSPDEASEESEASPSVLDDAATDGVRGDAEPDEPSEPEPASVDERVPGDGQPLEAWAADTAAGVSVEALPAAISRARARIDRAVLTYARLDPAARDALLEAPAEVEASGIEQEAVEATDEELAEVVERLDEAQQEVESLAHEREEAEEEVDDATTETGRVVAEERARLLRVKEAQAVYQLKLAAQERALVEAREDTLRARREVREQIRALSAPEAPAKMSHEGYDRVVDALRVARAELRAAFEELYAPSQAPAVPQVDKAVQHEAERQEHQRLRRELGERVEALMAREAQVRWKTVQVRRENMITLVEVRAELLDALPTSIEEEVTGFGARGRQQVVGELSQLNLELRWMIASMPRWAGALVDAAREEPTHTLVSATKLVLLLVLFRWIRRRSDEFLKGVHRRVRNHRRSRARRPLLRLVGHLRRVQAPVEYFVLALAMLELLFDLDNNVPAWLALQAVGVLCGGLVLIRLVDAMAARASKRVRNDDSAAALRLRSLRLVVGYLILVAMLSMAVHAILDRGALYRWILRLWWWAAFPIVVLLLVWWRHTVFARLETRAEPGALVRLITQHRSGLAGLCMVPMGAAVLIIDGGYRFVLRQAGRFVLLQHLLAYLLRRGASRSGFVDFGSGQYQPLSSETYHALDPSAPCSDVDESIAFEPIKAAAELMQGSGGAFIAIVGPRGSGRSTTVRRIAERVGRHRVIHVECPKGGVEDLTRALAAAAGLPCDDEALDLSSCLERMEADILAIDGLHRLAQPRVGGLKQLDALLRAIRDSNASVAWIATLESAAWLYIRRAWDAETMFDYTIWLEPWEEEAVERLVVARSKAAGIEPSFEGLEVPQQLLVDVTLSEEERNEQAFYRILWDYTDGNPGLALSFWRDSLVDMGADTLGVRLFVAPATTELNDLPSIAFFVLRAVAQLELATFSELVECTNLRSSEVSNAVRLLSARGCVETTPEGFSRIQTKWYPATMRLLRRQHLLGD